MHAQQKEPSCLERIHALSSIQRPGDDMDAALNPVAQLQQWPIRQRPVELFRFQSCRPSIANFVCLARNFCGDLQINFAYRQPMAKKKTKTGTTPYKAMGNAIREARERRLKQAPAEERSKWSQAAVAKLISKTRPAYANYEDGSNAPRPKVIPVLCRVLDIDQDALLRLIHGGPGHTPDDPPQPDSQLAELQEIWHALTKTQRGWLISHAKQYAGIEDGIVSDPKKTGRYK
jgi:transcriptional regulator with XRE-family HTH domain